MELLNYLFCDMFGGILECYELTHVLPYPDPPPPRQSCMSGPCYTIGCVIKGTHGAYVVVFLQQITFYHGMVTLVIFLIKNNLNRHIKYENLLSIYENMDYFQIMLFTVTCWKFQKIQQPYIKRYSYVLFSTNIVEILLKLRADATSGSGAVKAFLQGSSSPSPSPSSSSLLFSIFA